MPLAGLPVAAGLLTFVVYAIASNKFWPLMLCHVAGGALWTSIDLFVGLAIGPIIGGMSPPARAEFSAKFMPKMVIIMPTVVTMTLATGLQIAIHLGALGLQAPTRNWLVVSMVVVGIMAVVALGILEPANIAVLWEMNKPKPRSGDHRPDDEALRLHRRRHRCHADRHVDHHDQGGHAVSADGEFPKAIEVVTVSLAAVVVGGVWLGSHAPRRPPLGLPSVLLVVAGVLLLVGFVMITRVAGFSWNTFVRVGRWALLAYVIAAGMIEFAFVRNHTAARP